MFCNFSTAGRVTGVAFFAVVGREFVEGVVFDIEI